MNKQELTAMVAEILAQMGRVHGSLIFLTPVGVKEIFLPPCFLQDVHIIKYLILIK